MGHHRPRPLKFWLLALIICVASLPPAGSAQTNNQQEIEQFAAELVAAQTPQERQRLLNEKKNLVTVELAKQLTRKSAELLAERKSAEALSIAELTLSIAEPLGDASLLARVLGLNGNIHRVRGDFERALEYLQRSLKVSQAAGNDEDMMQALNLIGAVYFYQSRYETAIEYIQRSAQLAEKIGNLYELSHNLNNLSMIYKAQGDYAKSLDALLRSLKHAEASGDKTIIVYTLNSIGIAYQLLRDYKQAQEYHLRSLQMAEANGDQKGIEAALQSLGIISVEQGDSAQALEYYLKALEVARKRGDKRGIAIVLVSLGTAYDLQGNYALALENYQQSLKLFEEVGDKIGVFSALSNIGRVHSGQGNYEQALAYLQKGLELKGAVQDKGNIADSLISIGIIYFYQGNYARALEYLEKTLNMAEEMKDRQRIARTLTTIGNVYDAQENYARALDYYQKGLKLQEELGDKIFIAKGLASIAITYLKLGQAALALETSTRSAALSAQIDLPEILWEAYTIEGQAHLALNQRDLARQAFLDAIAVIEKLRGQTAGGEQDRQRYLERRIAPYYALIDLAVSEKNLTQALTYAESSKGRVLLDVLSNGRVNVTKAMTVDEIQQDRALTNDISHLNTQISGLKQQPKPDATQLSELNSRLEKARLEYESFQTNLFAAHPELKGQRGQTQPVTMAEAARLLKDGQTALLEFVVADEKSYLFVLTKNAEAKTQSASPVTLNVYPLNIKSKTLSELAEGFRQQVAERNLNIKQSARQLYDLLIKPAEKQLQGVKKLCIVPDGLLWNLPFQALLHPDKGYLLEQYSIFYAPSLSVLREMTRKGSELKFAQSQHRFSAPRKSSTVPPPSSSSSTELLALGNPSLGSEKSAGSEIATRADALGPLPEAEKEVMTLGQLYGPEKSKVLTGDKATEETVKAEGGKYRVLHFATHAILDDVNPMYSKIILSRDGNKTDEDGLLEAWEIMKLDLSTSLVVMSACQTARGRFGAGEGVIGMTWALFTAGSPAVVVSQWKVDSARTSELMIEFHKNLLRQQASGKSAMSKSEALREAALKLMHGTYNHPAYWAGFILIGDDE